jgi:alpha-glucosidase
MRYAGSDSRRALAALVAISGLAAGAGAACTGAPREDFTPPPPSTPLDAGGGGDPAATCGEGGDLPAGARRDDAAHRVTVACDGDAKELAITHLADGVVRLAYGSEARGSIVPIERRLADEPLRTGHRGGAAVVCTPQIELSVVPGACRLVARDVATATVVLDDGDEGGFARGRASARGGPERDVASVVRVAAPGERFYGLGLHTAVMDAAKGLDLRGSIVELWNTDAFDAAAGGFPADAPHLYESIPFYVGLRGKTAYGVFTDETHRTRFDLASTAKDRVRVTSFGARIDQYLVPGPSMKDVLRRYTGLTGRTPLPPPWALGFHQSRWEGPCDGSPAAKPFCSAAQIAAVAQRFRDLAVPLDGVFLDIQHMDGFRSFTFDKQRFADPDALFTQLALLGVRAHAIVDPGIKVDPAWEVYQQGLAGEMFLKTPAGAVFEGEVWPGPAAFPDFTAPKTRDWWSGLVAGAAARGLSGMWIDMNEPASFAKGGVPDELPVNGDGRATTMAEAHNAYAYEEARATFEGLKKARPSERPFVLSRAAFAGQQRYSAVWTGDAPSTWTSLGMTLPQLLELGMSGIAFAGSDVGGYSGREESTADLFSRWMALGAVSPFFRAHAEKDARRQEPWAFDDDTLDATRELVGLRYELFPYLYSTFEESSRTGAPVLRPLVLEFQDDDAAQAIGDEAMLGPSLLVAPVLTKGAQTSRSVYLPKGRWFELRSGAVAEGGKRVTVSAAPAALPRDALPIWVREGAIVPRTARVQHTAQLAGAPLFLDVYPSDAKTTYTLYEDDGRANGAFARTTFTLSRAGGVARLEASAREGAFDPKHERTIVRFHRVDREPSSVKIGGQALARAESAAAMPAGTFAWDANDRTLLVATKDGAGFTLEAAYDPSLDEGGLVDVPLRVALPPGTPGTIHVASSAAGWTHAPLSRSGDVATGTMKAPRGGFVFFKITRGGWPTVEKGPGCVEIDDRHAFGAAKPVEVTVAAFADRCP